MNSRIRVVSEVRIVSDGERKDRNGDKKYEDDVENDEDEEDDDRYEFSYERDT